jgi:acetyl-CoA carboxylase biotin carboxyl carrier protein
MTGDELQPESAEELPTTEPGLVEPIAVGPGEPEAMAGNGAAGEATPAPTGADRGADGAAEAALELADIAADPADASLLALVDRLAALLERSDLGELEVAAGDTTVILRSPAAIDRPAAAAPAPGAEHAAGADGGFSPTPVAPEAAPAPIVPVVSARPSVKAPLTGIFYGAPSPGATAYVAVGDHVAVGQIIGLIEAMKLFNEIKSDLAGRVVRVCADNGALVKAKQPLIEVEPA